jgi:hypothetical protein
MEGILKNGNWQAWMHIQVVLCTYSLNVVCCDANLSVSKVDVRNLLRDGIREAQRQDPELQELKEEPEYSISGDGMILLRDRVCVPNDDEIKDLILKESHNSQYSVHPGATKMYQDMRKSFWWPGMKRDIANFVTRCLTYQKVKVEHQKPSGPLQPLEIPEWKWESIAMDFVVGLPRTPAGYDSIWVIIDRLTKSAHFLPVRSNYTVERYAKVYIQEIVRLHGAPLSIVSDRDPKFTSRFWEALQRAFGTQLHLSTAYHPQTDGQSERTIQTLEDMLRACILEEGGDWCRYLLLVDFAYNNGYHSSIGMAPCEALYSRKCRSPVCWYETGEKILLGPELVQETTDKIRRIKEKLKVSQDRQRSYADQRRKTLEFEEGEHVFLKVSPTTAVGRSMKVKKLQPRYVGPFQILQRIGSVAYRLALPPNLSNLHDVFHVSQIRKYVPDPSHILSPNKIQLKSNTSYQAQPLEILDRGEKTLQNKVIPLVKVLWQSIDSSEITWEKEQDMKDTYPELF